MGKKSKDKERLEGYEMQAAMTTHLIRYFFLAKPNTRSTTASCCSNTTSYIVINVEWERAGKYHMPL
jgi:hypothetical protein